VSSSAGTADVLTSSLQVRSHSVQRSAVSWPLIPSRPITSTWSVPQ